MTSVVVSQLINSQKFAMTSSLVLLILALSSSSFCFAKPIYTEWDCYAANAQFPFGLKSKADHDFTYTCWKIVTTDDYVDIPGMYVDCERTRRQCTKGSPACEHLVDICCEAIVKLCREEGNPREQIQCFHELMGVYSKSSEICPYTCLKPNGKWVACIYRDLPTFPPEYFKTALPYAADDASSTVPALPTANQTSDDTLALSLLAPGHSVEKPLLKGELATSNETLQFSNSSSIV